MRENEMERRPLVYLASPLFNENERAFNVELARRLANFGNVFLPQRDGELLMDLIQSGIVQSVAERRVFQNDIKAIRSADLLVAVLDGGYIDEGVAFEIGFANGIQTPCVGLQTDVRRALPTGNNPMISQGLSKVFDRIDNLICWMTSWNAGRTVVRAPAA
jgi:nucleoside 2-deoxyribosyltransferase